MPRRKPKAVPDQTGRRTAFDVNPELVEQLCQALASGSTLLTAADLCGVARSTVQEWVQRGRQAQQALDLGETPDPLDNRYREVADRIGKSRAQAKVRALAIIQVAAPKDWKAAAWYLEHAHPDEYGRTQRLTVVGEADSPVGVRTVPVQPTDPDQVERLEAVMRRSGLLPDPEAPRAKPVPAAKAKPRTKKQTTTGR